MDKPNPPPTDYENLFRLCDSEIRAGRGAQIAHLLAGLNVAKVPRAWRLPFAYICRRTARWSLGLRLLAPIVKSPKANSAPPEKAELAEYAILLMKVGCADEALKTIENNARISSERSPEILMAQASYHLMAWQHEEALGPLNAYLEVQADPYLAFVARVNLASALIGADRLDEAIGTLNPIIEEARRLDYARLLGNCLELRAQGFLRLGMLSTCEKDLEEAAKILAADRTSDQLFIKKWQSILSATKSGSIDGLHAFREEALSRQHWESVRDADLFSLKIQFEQAKFEHLLFGTPFASYRTRVARELGGRERGGDVFILGASGTRCLDLSTGSLEGRTVLNPGKKIHQLVELLLRDFYRPAPLGAIFSRIFPDEYFDTFSSANRVHQLIWRARQWISEERMPLALLESEGSFSLRPLDGFSIALPYQRSLPETSLVQWEKVQPLLALAGATTAAEIQTATGLNRSTVRRLLEWAVRSGRIEKHGAGPATGYSLSSQRAA